MLREAPSASSDDARLDHAHDIESGPDDTYFDAAFDGAPPEVRAAAVRRSRCLPEPATMRTAWASLPLDVRDRVGVMALTHSFYSRTLWRDDYRYLAGEKSRHCEKWESEALNAAEAEFVAALPELYGTDDEEPVWAQHDNVAVVFPALSHPSPLTAAIAAHLQAERDYAAVLGRPAEDPERMALEAAEEAARQAVIAVQPRDRADLVALYEHLSYNCGESAEEPLARALDGLALALQLGAVGV